MTTRILGFLLLCCLQKVSAQNAEEVTKAVMERDSIFWQAYNNCDINTMADFVTEDLEFYHDKGGPSFGSKPFLDNTKNNLCSSNKFRLRREVVPGSMHVYLLHKGNEVYGAILSGLHVFYVTENGNPPYLDGESSFTNLWIFKDGKWKMSRVLSYDHHPAAKSKKAS